MKHFHLHAHVEDLQRGIAFYPAMSAIEHRRIQTDTEEGLAELKTRAQAADIALFECAAIAGKSAASCC